jgi:hypothetical protein
MSDASEVYESDQASEIYDSDEEELSSSSNGSDSESETHEDEEKGSVIAIYNEVALVKCNDTTYKVPGDMVRVIRVRDGDSDDEPTPGAEVYFELPVRGTVTEVNNSEVTVITVKDTENQLHKIVDEDKIYSRHEFIRCGMWAIINISGEDSYPWFIRHINANGLVTVCYVNDDESVDDTNEMKVKLNQIVYTEVHKIEKYKVGDEVEVILDSYMEERDESEKGDDDDEDDDELKEFNKNIHDFSKEGSDDVFDDPFHISTSFLKAKVGDIPRFPDECRETLREMSRPDKQSVERPTRNSTPRMVVQLEKYEVTHNYNTVHKATINFKDTLGAIQYHTCKKCSMDKECKTHASKKYFYFRELMRHRRSLRYQRYLVTNNPNPRFATDTDSMRTIYDLEIEYLRKRKEATTGQKSEESKRDDTVEMDVDEAEPDGEGILLTEDYDPYEVGDVGSRYPLDASKSYVNYMEEEDDESAEEDYESETDSKCERCDQEHNEEGNELLCCDYPKCTRVSHVQCAGFEKVPEGDWFCIFCTRRKKMKSEI